MPEYLQLIAFKFIGRVLFVDLQPYHSITQHVRYVYQVGIKMKYKNNSPFQKENSALPFISQLKPAVTTLEVEKTSEFLPTPLQNGSPKRKKVRVSLYIPITN